MINFDKKTSDAPVIIINYPRSGSNFLHYCVENLFNIDIWKNHGQSPEFWQKERYPSIFLLRNYKECVPRQLGCTKRGNEYDLESIKSHMRNANATKDTKTFDYIKVLKYYDELEKEKLLIYYEDLISNTENELKRLVDFMNGLGFKTELFNDFIINLEKHRKESLKRYTPTSSSGGNVKIFHSKNIRDKDKNSLDKFLQKTYPNLWDKYLKIYED
tara:strand:+ start:15680 stop:16327 length:648 start_codon:yes stop_codon:yes gene_type:complete